MAFEVRNPELEKQLQGIGNAIKDAMLPGFGFALLIFSYKPGVMFYTSSAERDTVIAAMREFIAKHEPN